MSQLPDQFRSFNGTRRLPFPEPLHHSFRMPRRRRGRGIRSGGRFDEEVSKSRERGSFLERREGIVIADVTGLDECGANAEGVCLIQHALDQSLHGELRGTKWA